MRVVSAIVINAAAMLLESAPFILASAIAVRVSARLGRHIVPYLGCGCGSGPSARSLPAFAAAWIVFGPFVAAARLGAAIVVERFVAKRACARDHASMLADLAAIFPFAVGAAALAPLLPAIAGSHVPRQLAGVLAALAAFVASPCALGAVAIAAVARQTAPAAAVGFLCVAGIFDLRTWMRSREHIGGHDCIAYALAAVACALVAIRNGAALVNPRSAPALWICAIVFACLAHRYRMQARPALRIAPTIMLAGCILSAPPPIYSATETTLADAFPGERIDFTGTLVHSGDRSTLMRYAITCCRADATPVAIRLESPAKLRGGWARARGTLVPHDGELRLRIDSIEAVAAPPDPFIYR
jgi:hypothetical protein